MKILIACEFSGVVREAFRKRGHDAWSCDLIKSIDNSQYHIQGDVLNIINQNWDLIIAHPPCQYLCSSGLHWNTKDPIRQQKTKDSLDFVRKILNANCDKIALENPVGCISTQISKPTQKIHPWQFGDNASKTTCLWLKNLPMLKPTKIIPPKGYFLVKFANDNVKCECCDESFCKECDCHYADCSCVGPHQDDQYKYIQLHGYLWATKLDNNQKPIWANQTPSGQNKLGPSEARAQERAITYQGIADAMAEQWS